MNELKIFENPAFGKIRTVEIDDTPYFVGKDVAEVLGYAKPENAIANHVDDEDKTSTLIQGSGSNYKSKATIINESGLYSLILSSKLPKAKEFKRWVTSEVLPTIHKHGMYATEELLDNPDFAIKVFNELKAEREKRKALETTVDVQKQLIGELKPKADYTDLVLKSKTLLTTTQIAKDYGMSGKKFNKLLNELKIQYKTGGYNKQWLLYSKYQDKGWTHSDTIRFTHSDGREDFVLETKWTQKGRLGLYELLKKRNILPMIERP
jgi:prophage antirepressor-like protein